MKVYSVSAWRQPSHVDGYGIGVPGTRGIVTPYAGLSLAGRVKPPILYRGTPGTWLQEPSSASRQPDRAERTGRQKRPPSRSGPSFAGSTRPSPGCGPGPGLPRHGGQRNVVLRLVDGPPGRTRAADTAPGRVLGATLRGACGCSSAPSRRPGTLSFQPEEEVRRGGGEHVRDGARDPGRHPLVGVDGSSDRDWPRDGVGEVVLLQGSQRRWRQQSCHA